MPRPRRRRDQPEVSEPVAAAEPEPERLPAPEPEPPVEVAEPEPAPQLTVEPDPAVDHKARGGGLYGALFATGLTKVFAIAGRELAGYFVSPIGWVITPVVIVVVSYFGYVLPVLVSQQATMDGVFGLVAFLLIVPIVPLLTMRVLAEERRQGTLEMLLTSPVRDWELVVGKWLGSLVFFCSMFSFTLVYVVLFLVFLPKVVVKPFGIPLSIGNLDLGLLASGYVGLLILGAAFLAIGVLCSSVTQNQIVAAFLTFGALIVIYYCGLAAQFLTAPYDGFFRYVGGQNRYAGFGLGQVALKDVAYFASLILGSLFLATRVLESRKWR